MESDTGDKNIIDLNEEIIRLRADNKKLREILKKEREQRLKMTKVLVVDDSELMQEIILDALMEFGSEQVEWSLRGRLLKPFAAPFYNSKSPEKASWLQVPSTL